MAGEPATALKAGTVRRASETVAETVDYADVYARPVPALGRSAKAREYLASHRLGELADIGYNPGTDYKKLRQCVVFGLRDGAGAVVSLYGRSVVPGAKGRHFYTANRRGLYPGWPAVDAERVVLTESVIDAATLRLHTGETVLTLYGTNGLGAEHLVALDRLEQLWEVVLFLDGDDAGRAAVAKWSAVMHERIPHVGVSAVDTPEGEDVNGLAVAGTRRSWRT